jgi:hypothetical protein
MHARFPFDLAYCSKRRAPPVGRASWRRAVAVSLIGCAGWFAAHVAATAQETSTSTPPAREASPPAEKAATTPPAQDAAISIELNKLEPQGQGCRAYFVVGNKATEYQELKLDLVLFRPDGVIGRRFAVDLAPLRADKRSVKLFDIEGTKCDEVGSFLINDVMECKAQSGPVSDCLKNISVSTRTKVELNK